MHILRFFIAFMVTGIMMMPVSKAQDRIPDDAGMKVGRLENGLTYYIRNNTENKGCADFYIIHNVGALQEEDNQNGLAHFLEHMAFNGTKNYPDKTILNFLEKDGVRFGYNVNAYTSRYETVYNISEVPLVRETFVDSVLLVLHDWSCAISCEEDALNAERGVISEEWRRKDEPRALMAELQNNMIYRGAKHTERNVLGTLEIINGFKRQEILDFYHKWYRPDLQAIAVVGDVDVEDMEKRIGRMFSDIPAQKNPAQKETYAIPAQDGPLFENMLHPMIKVNTLKIFHKQPFPAREVRSTTGYYKDLVLRQIATEILKERFNRATMKDGCPAKHVALVTNRYSDDFYTSMFTISPKKEDLQEEILAFYAKEVKRLLDHGFSADELQAARFQATKRTTSHSQVNIKNRDWIKSCIEHFLRGEALISPEEKKEIQAEMIEEATAEEVAEYLKKMFVESEKIYSYTIDMSKTAILPSAERMQSILAEVDATPLEPEFPEFRKINLDVDVPAAYTTGLDRLPAESRFGNGAEILRIKSEPVKSKNHMVIKAVFNTGFSAFDQNRIESSRVAAAYIDRNIGFRNYTHKDLRDSPVTGNISVMLEIDREESAITVLCGKNDVQKAFNMLYLTLTEPWFDTEKNLDRFKTMQIKSLERGREGKTLYDEEHRNRRYCNHPWRTEITKEHYEAVDMELVKDVFDRCFGDAGRMKVYVCDDLEDKELHGLYNMVASLPSKKTDLAVMDGKHASCPLYVGKCCHKVENPLKTVPKSEVKLSFKSDMKLGNEETVIFDVLDYIMNARCMNRIREERGGTYSVTFRTELFPQGEMAESSIAFQTRPEMTDILVEDAQNLMNDMAAEGPSEDEFENARKYLAKHHLESCSRYKDNLSRRLDNSIKEERFGLNTETCYIEILDKLNEKDIRKMAKKILKGDSMLSVYTEK